MLNTVLQQPLTLIIALLTVSLAILVALPSYNLHFFRRFTLAISLIALAIGLLGCLAFDKSMAGFQFLYRLNIAPQYNLTLTLGVDGLGLLFTLLTLFVFPVCFLAS
jgi:NADH:ubiquinone oxidoreductase subunit 4 (subunit M)